MIITHLHHRRPRRRHRHIMSLSKTDNFSDIYYDVKNVGALGGISRLSKETNVKSKRKTQDWLRTQATYSLHRPLRKKFPTRKYQTSGPNELWQMDLMEMIPYARINKGFRYILTCIDVFSRFARAIPVKSKSGEDVCKAIKLMLKENVFPRYVQTDLGKEFYNKHVKSLFTKHNIEHYTIYSQFKAALVERFNRTLREKLSRYFTHQGNKVWFKVLPSLIDTYNRSKHRGINGRKPIDITSANAFDLWEEQQRDNTTNRKNTLPLNTYVRISRIANGPFIKNFDQNWSEEVFRVVACNTKITPVMYTLEDLKNNIIQGGFYHEELQDIGPNPPVMFRIEKILRTKGKGKDKKLYVKWHGYDSTYNSWISASNIQ